MEYLTFTLLFIAAWAGVSATVLSIIQYIKPRLTWTQRAIWIHADICKYALWASIPTSILGLYL
jgi:hypothetical protein